MASSTGGVAQGNDDEASASEVGQYLTFTMDDRYYGVNITSVREIRGWEDPTPMPESPDYMLGVTNLRGEMVPIFDLRLKFSLGKTDVTSKHVIIVVKIGNRMTGIVADTVSDILDAGEGEIKPAPAVQQAEAEEKYVKGLIAIDEQMVILLDTDMLFDLSELGNIHEHL